MRQILGPLAVFACGMALLAESVAAQSFPPASPSPPPPAARRPAQPPVKDVKPVDPPTSELMTVHLVRSNDPGCEPNCPEWLAAQGRIDQSTPAEFRKAFSKLGKRKLPILIDSAGGSVDHGIVIGRMIRAKGLDVVVTKTVIKPCDPQDAACRKLAQQGILLGKPEAKISKCASSCAFILAGGVRRYVGPWTLVGVHEIATHQTLRQVQRLYRVERQLQWGVPVETKRTLVQEKVLQTYRFQIPTEDKTYEKIVTFFKEMGIHDNINTLLRSAPHTSIRWLRADDLKTTGIATDFINGDQLLTPGSATATAALPSPSSPSPARTLPPAPPAAAIAAIPGPAAAPPPPAPSSPLSTSSVGPSGPAPAAASDEPPTAEPTAPAKTAAKPKPKAKSPTREDSDTSWRPF